MAGAQNAAGLLGKFGCTSFTSVSTARNVQSSSDPRLPPRHLKSTKFFKSRNLKDSENIIAEEDDSSDTEKENAEIDSEISQTYSKPNSSQPVYSNNDGLLKTSEGSTPLRELNTSSALHSSSELCLDHTADSSALASFSIPSLATPRTESMKSRESNIRVALRSRPLVTREEHLKDSCAGLMSILDISAEQVVLGKMEKYFKFDRHFDEHSSQEDVYRLFAEPIISKVAAQFNASVFAYGQTGSGKTYTMGTNGKIDYTDTNNCGEAGIIPRAISQIFKEASSCSMKISFYEIMNEQVFDLINPSKQKVPLAVREVPNVGLFKIAQLTEIPVANIAEAMGLLQQGTSLRSTESTTLNQQSSRSHAVFTVTVASEVPGRGCVIRRLNLVDLAGSESVRRTNSTGERFSEGVNINKGLLSLGKLIRALVKKTHAPYRDSVLTKVLKESLQSTSFISMIACVSPSPIDKHETLSTLRFANEVKQLTTKPIPTFLLESPAVSMKKKSRYENSLSHTPSGNWNKTIHTPTPSKAVGKQGTKRQLNQTIGTPGKRARGEASFITPRPKLQRPVVTSTIVRRVGVQEMREIDRPVSPDLANFSNISSVSIIQADEPGPRSNSSSVLEPVESESRFNGPTFSVQDMSSVLSPLMRKLTETLTQEVRKIGKVRIPDSRADETPPPPPRRVHKPRMTSSPVWSTSKTIVDAITTDQSTAANVDAKSSPGSPSEKVISGTLTNFEQSNMTKRRLQSVIASASPQLGKASSSTSTVENEAIPVYDSPASTACPVKITHSPTIEEMERSLGICPDSPLAPFCVPRPVQTAAAGGGGSRKPSRQSCRRSTRRTTMMGEELAKSLQLIRDASGVNGANRRRSGRPIRAASKDIFYGSPKVQLQDTKKVDKDLPEVSHPLLNGDLETVKADMQKEHNKSILTLLNTGNLKLITSLPAIGPKSGLIIYHYRQLNDGIKCLKELQTIHGLGAKFYNKFIRQNQIVLSP